MGNSSSKSRGVRNNNPGNIRCVPGRRWQGQAAEQLDKDFVTFEDPVYGIRALAVVLLTYYRRYRLNTVAEIIRRWAPPVENDTDAYIATVARRMGVLPATKLNLLDRDTLRNLVTAIIHVETGGYQYPRDVIETALDMALERVPPLALRDVAHTDTARGSTAAAAATAIGSVGTIISGLAEMDWRAAIAVVIAITVIATITVWLWRAKRQ